MAGRELALQLARATQHPAARRVWVLLLTRRWMPGIDGRSIGRCSRDAIGLTALCGAGRRETWVPSAHGHLRDHEAQDDNQRADRERSTQAIGEWLMDFVPHRMLGAI
jgi:hypothetical protein